MAATRKVSANKNWGAVLTIVLVVLVLAVALTNLPIDNFFAGKSGQAPPRLNQKSEIRVNQIGLVPQEAPVTTFGYEDYIGAQTNQSGTIVLDTEVSIAGAVAPTQSGATQGSLINAILAAACILSLFMMILSLASSKVRDYRIFAARTVAAAVALALIASWSLIDKFQMPTQLTNDATLLIAILFGVYAIILGYSYLYEAWLNNKKFGLRGKELFTQRADAPSSSL